MRHSIDYLKVQECKLFLTQTLLILQSVECIFAMPFIIAVGYQIYNKNKGLLLHILVKPLVTLAVSQEFCKLFDLKGRHLMQFCSKILQYNIIHFFFWYNVKIQNTTTTFVLEIIYFFLLFDDLERYKLYEWMSENNFNPKNNFFTWIFSILFFFSQLYLPLVVILN